MGRNNGCDFFGDGKGRTRRLVELPHCCSQDGYNGTLRPIFQLCGWNDLTRNTKIEAGRHSRTRSTPLLRVVIQGS